MYIDSACVSAGLSQRCNCGPHVTALEVRLLERIRSGKFDHLVAEILGGEESSEIGVEDAKVSGSGSVEAVKDEAPNPIEHREAEKGEESPDPSAEAPLPRSTEVQDTPQNDNDPQRAEEPALISTAQRPNNEDPKQWYLNDEKFAAYIRLSKQRNEQLREFVLQLKKPFAEMPNQQVEPVDSAPKLPERLPQGDDKWYLNDELFAAYMHESKKDTKKLTEFVHEMKSVAYSMGLHVELRSIDEQLD